MFVLVSYDVAMQDNEGPRRLRRVAKACKGPMVSGCNIRSSSALWTLPNGLCEGSPDQGNRHGSGQA